MLPTAEQLFRELSSLTTAEYANVIQAKAMVLMLLKFEEIRDHLQAIEENLDDLVALQPDTKPKPKPKKK